jgi:hypothetical protein
MYQQNVPSEVYAAIGGESPDFVVKSNRKIPLKKALHTLGFGLVWLVFMSIFVATFLWPVLMGREVHFESNGVPTTAGPGNLGPIVGPAIFIGIFVLIGLGVTIYGLYSIFAKGAWYIGTAKRMIIYEKNKMRSIDWTQFSGDIEVSGLATDGLISLSLKTAHMIEEGKGPARYVPDSIYIVGVSDAFKIEELLRKRITENNPSHAMPQM